MDKNKKTQQHSPDSDQMEQWLKDYFLDPHTTHEDHTIFKIDIYETDDHWIVEADLKDYLSSELEVKIEGSILFITAFPSSLSKKERRIHFPFPIIHHCVSALFQDGLLEIFISKKENGIGKNRYITLP